MIDVPEQQGLARMRRFAVPEPWRAQLPQTPVLAQRVAEVLQAPSLLARRRIDLARLTRRSNGISMPITSATCHSPPLRVLRQPDRVVQRIAAIKPDADSAYPALLQA